jgi:hypothetical protein
MKFNAGKAGRQQACSTADSLPIQDAPGIAAVNGLQHAIRKFQPVQPKTPELVKQEFYGLLMAHYAIRGLMHEAALKADEAPDRLSFLHSVRVVQRRMATHVTIPPSAEESLA